ncbi:MAG: AAA family ATPase [Acidobacteria bacterium]|nr:AAA family ATPase [Acidobacteriota bacterium]
MEPQNPAAESRAAKMIREVFESGRPVSYVRTSEEQRVAAVLRAVRLDGDVLPVWTWSLTEGFASQDGVRESGTGDPRKALDFVVAAQGPAIFHLKDLHEPLRDHPEIRRRLRDVYDACRDRRKFAVITAPVRYLPEEIERSVAFLELRPPDAIELTDFVRRETGVPPEAADRAAVALQGLTIDESRYALRRALAVSPTLEPECLPALYQEKKLLIQRTGFIELIDDAGRLEDIGGLDILKKWLLERRKLFQLRETLAAEIVPKGLLMMGIPGCGKSACVKAIASCFGLPLYRIEMIEIFSGRHGKPEGAFVEACKMMEEMAPAVLWFDEIEMGINSTENAGEQGRMFAFFLTWMQEKTSGLFVAATANRIDLLPAEMIRKGRFDEVFFVDIPSQQEQIEIFKIHLNRRKVDSAGFDFQQLTTFTNGWTGAEIEQCVVSAITRARLADRPVLEHDLISIAAKQVPLSRTMKEQINHIREWAFERAIRASANQSGR